MSDAAKPSTGKFSRLAILGKDTPITLGVAIAIVLGVVAYSRYENGRYEGLAKELTASQTGALEKIRQDQAKANDDRRKELGELKAQLGEVKTRLAVIATSQAEVERLKGKLETQGEKLHECELRTTELTARLCSAEGQLADAKVKIRDLENGAKR